MSAPKLSDDLRALALFYRAHEFTGCEVSPARARELAARLEEHFIAALCLEHARAERDELLAVARDVDLMEHARAGGPSLNRLREVAAKAAAPVPDTNVVLFPIVPIRRGYDDGDVA
jgi:hypothetical protein